jgi:hypothetical protein
LKSKTGDDIIMWNGMRWLSGEVKRKRPFYSPLFNEMKMIRYKNDRFAKTGSGQTKGKFKTGWTCSRRATRPSAGRSAPQTQATASSRLPIGVRIQAVFFAVFSHSKRP